MTQIGVRDKAHEFSHTSTTVFPSPILLVLFLKVEVFCQSLEYSSKCCLIPLIQSNIPLRTQLLDLLHQHEKHGTFSFVQACELAIMSLRY